MEEGDVGVDVDPEPSEVARIGKYHIPVREFKQCGRINERKAGNRIHFCLVSDLPINVYGRLVGTATVVEDNNQIEWNEFQ